MLPLALAVAAFGVSYGVLARSVGMGAFAPIVMSATAFSGAAQFAAASVLDLGGTAVAAVAAALLLNARFVPMSVVVAVGFRGGVLRRLLGSQLIVDESWALAVRPGGRFDVPFLFGAGLVLYPTWVASTAVGVVAGDFVGDPERLGLDAAFPALFLCLVVAQARTRRTLAAAIVGGLIALVLIPVSPPGVPIMAASLACALGWRR